MSPHSCANTLCQPPLISWLQSANEARAHDSRGQCPVAHRYTPDQQALGRWHQSVSFFGRRELKAEAVWHKQLTLPVDALSSGYVSSCATLRLSAA